MSVKNRKIGRGLSSLLGDITFSEIEAQINRRLDGNSSKDGVSSLSSFRVLEVPIDLIEVNPNQPRKHFDSEAITELSESIRESGLLQPIIVQQNGEKYIIIAGERRYRASKQAGLQAMPCIIKNLTEEQTFLVAMIENIQRTNLDPLEEAVGYKTICEKYNLSQAELSKMIGKSRSHIANMIGILSMPDEIQTMLSNGELSIGHAKVLKRIHNKTELTDIAKKVKKESMSVRALEKHIDEITSLHAENKQISEENIGKIQLQSEHKIQMLNPTLSITPQEILAMEDAFNANFSQMMHIQHSIDDSGKIVIHYADIDELRDVMSKIIDLSDIYVK
jgi:ParB family transcriptional regulator, chromosome partitioning protein